MDAFLVLIFSTVQFRTVLHSEFEVHCITNKPLMHCESWCNKPLIMDAVLTHTSLSYQGAGFGGRHDTYTILGIISLILWRCECLHTAPLIRDLVTFFFMEYNCTYTTLIFSLSSFNIKDAAINLLKQLPCK